MKIKTWVDVGAEVEINIDTQDICAALSESFSEALEDPLGEPQGTHRITRAFNHIASFLGAFSDKQLALMNDPQRRVIGQYLLRAGRRFQPADVHLDLLEAAKRKLADCRENGDCSDAALMPDEYCSHECVALAEAVAKAEPHPPTVTEKEKS